MIYWSVLYYCSAVTVLFVRIMVVLTDSRLCCMFALFCITLVSGTFLKLLLTEIHLLTTTQPPNTFFSPVFLEHMHK